MTSQLNVDTIADKAGSGPVGLTKQTAAKVFVKMSGATQVINKSFNVSSRSDNGAGQSEITFVSAMDGVHFSKTALADLDTSIGNGLHAYGSDGQSSSATPTSTKTRVDVLNYNDTADGDFGYLSITIHGDLA